MRYVNVSLARSRYLRHLRALSRIMRNSVIDRDLITMMIKRKVRRINDSIRLLTIHYACAVYDHSEPYGMSCYRLLTKTGNYIYLRTHGYLEYDKDTQKMISFVCINTLVS